jgi:hypothetical protein
MIHTQLIYYTMLALLLMIQMNAHLYHSLSFAQVRTSLFPISLNEIVDIYKHQFFLFDVISSRHRRAGYIIKYI